jgi:hypothetical protein
VPKPGWQLALLLVATAAVVTVMRFAPVPNLLGDWIDRLWVPSIIVAVIAVVRQLRK